jgi:hypothetical protein
MKRTKNDPAVICDKTSPAGRQGLFCPVKRAIT